eukprot:Platyproteum_vivax@DN13009_c0_g1_i1.p1
MKWFSAVVLSLLFCFVKSLKSRAIRAHLKNVSAHSEAIRARTTTIHRPSPLDELNKKILAFKTKTDDLKQQFADANANGTFLGENIEDKYVDAICEADDLAEDLDKLPYSTTKEELWDQLYASISKIEYVDRKMQERRYQEFTKELAEINARMDTWKPKIELATQMPDLREELKPLFRTTIEELGRMSVQIKETDFTNDYELKGSNLNAAVLQASERVLETIKKLG